MMNFFQNLAKSAGEIQHNPAACDYCDVCQRACRRHAIQVNPQTRSWTIQQEVCMRCQKCVRACPRQALSLGKPVKN